MRKWLVTLLVLVVLSGCAGTPGAWRGYGGEGSRSLAAKERGPRKPRLVWVVDLEADSPGAPVVDESGIYVPHSGGSVTKVDTKGRIQWRFDSWVSGENLMPPHLTILTDGKLLISTLGAREQTFRINSAGELLPGEWLPWPASMSPAVNDQGYVVVCHQYVNGAGHIALRVYGLMAGEEPQWVLDFSSDTQSYYASNPVLVSDGRAWVLIETDSEENFLHCIDSDGAHWQMEFLQSSTMGVGYAIAAGSDGTLFFGTSRVEDISRVYNPGWLYSVSADGDVLWRVEAGQRVVQIMVAPKMIVANILRAKLLAVDNRGKELWEYQLTGWESNAILDSRGTVYMAGVEDGTARLRAVDSRGKDLWEYDTGQRAESLSFMAFYDGVLYLVTREGKLLAISD